MDFNLDSSQYFVHGLEFDLSQYYLQSFPTDTELCDYLGTGRFTIIVSVHFYDNQSIQSRAKYDDKLINTTIVLHEEVYKK